jgi:hypothetical protein
MTRCRVFALLTLPTRRSLAWRGSEGSLRCHTVRDLVGEVVPQNEQQHELTIPSCEQNNWRLNLNLMTRENSTQAIRSHGYMRMTSRAQHEKRNGVREGCGKDAHTASTATGVLFACGLTGSDANRRKWLRFSLASTLTRGICSFNVSSNKVRDRICPIRVCWRGGAISMAPDEEQISDLGRGSAGSRPVH